MNAALAKLSYLARHSGAVLRRRRQKRNTDAILHEYNDGWRQFDMFLDKSSTLSDWLNIEGFDTTTGYFNINGRLTYDKFNSSNYYRETLIETLSSNFPKAKSVTEFGCGLGRNLLYLKSAMPQLDVYGYDLCPPGVDIAKSAAAKFGMSAQYACLDYLNDPLEKFIFPESDVVFTMFSLEQIPERVSVALDKILSRGRLGAIHIEPVIENYPLTYRGLLGRFDHWKLDYLSDFAEAAKQANGFDVSFERMVSAHNPLMFPSLYVFKRTQSGLCGNIDAKR